MKKAKLRKIFNTVRLQLVQFYTKHAVFYDIKGVKYDLDWRTGMVVIGNDITKPLLGSDLMKRCETMLPGESSVH